MNRIDLEFPLSKLDNDLDLISAKRRVMEKFEAELKGLNLGKQAVEEERQASLERESLASLRSSKELLEKIDSLKWLDETNDYYKSIMGEEDIAEKMFQFACNKIKEKLTNHTELPLSSNKDTSETKQVAEECGSFKEKGISLDNSDIPSSDIKCNSPPMAPIKEKLNSEKKDGK